MNGYQNFYESLWASDFAFFQAISAGVLIKKTKVDREALGNG